MQQIDQEILNAIKGKYLASVFQPDPPSLVDYCTEFDLELNMINAIRTISIRENWEDLRKENFEKAKLELQQRATGQIDAVMLDFRKALRGLLSSKMMMLETFKSQVDGQLLTALQENKLNANQLLRLKEMMAHDENTMLKLVIEMAKALGLADPDDPSTNGKPGDKKDATEKQDVISQYRTAAKAIEATAKSEIKSDDVDRARKPLFTQLDQQRDQPND